jgi:nitrate/nitrite transport system substrate-binding protein
MSLATVSSDARPAVGDDLEKRRLRIGFLPLTDSAPIIVAKERGFFRRHGLEVTLCREPSWANIRDKLTAGMLDAAAVLAPMALASAAGAGGFPVELRTAMSLDLNGNAVTVAPQLFEQMCAADPECMNHRPRGARPLRRVVEQRRRSASRPLIFAVVFPFSAHAYELRYWLAAAGIDPERDLRIIVAPPPTMVGLLGAGDIDGFCVGEPWSSHAVHLGIGRVVITKYEIWNNSPEKVLAVTAEWDEHHPRAHRALVRAVVDAARWLDLPAHRQEAAHIVAGETFVDAPVAAVQRSLVGPFAFGAGEEGTLDDFHVFYRYTATFPWRSHALWLLGQMWRWGQIERACDLRAIVRDVYRPDIYREATSALEIVSPRIDFKTEGSHRQSWWLEDATPPLRMGADAFIDGQSFDPDFCREYLAAQAISSPHVPLDKLEL